MEIKIVYRLVGNPETYELTLLPEQYFDVPIDEDGYSIHSTAKFIFPYEYLDCNLENILSIELNIKDHKSHFRREIFFWNAGKNSTDYIFQFDSKKSEYFEWLITTTVVTNSEGYNVEETLRLYKNKENRWIVTAHSYRTLMPLDKEDLVREMDVHNAIIGHVSGFRTSNI